MWKTSMVLVSALAVALATGGCDRANWEDPQYVKQQLSEGNPTEQKMALEKIEDLEDEDKKVLAPALANIYTEGGANSRAAMETLVGLQSEKAKEAYVEEIETNEAGYAGPAAEALGKMKATDMVPDLLELYENAESDQVKLAVLRGFEYMPEAQMVDPLLETLRLSVDNNPIELHRLSCKIIGDVVADSPDVLDKSGKRTLIRGVFLSSATGQDSQQACGLAVQKLGPSAVPILVETFNGENDEVNELMRKYRTDSTDFPPNKPKVGAIIRLTKLQAEEAKDLFVESLKEEREVPGNLPDKFVRPYLTYEAQSIDEMIMGLGALNATGAKELLREVLVGEYNETWSGVIDYRSELQLRQDAAFSLVRMGARDARDAMLKMALDGVIKGLEARAAGLEKRAEEKDNVDPMNPTQRYQFNWMAAQAFAHLATGDDIERYKKLISELGDDEKFEEVRKKLESFLPELELAERCHGKDSKEAQAKCFGESISAETKSVRKKAAWELVWLPEEIAGPVITEQLDTEDLEIRETLTLGLYRNPHEQAIEKITAILEDESSKTADSYKLDHYRLKLLRAWLRNHFS